jgi:hypothetical protein
LAHPIEPEQTKIAESLSEAIEAFMVVKVKGCNRVFSRISYALNIEKRKHSRDVRMFLADKASRLC